MSPLQVLLPLDIIENIVNILIDEPRGLRYVKTLSRTCHSFLPLCRKHIFSSIFIKSENNRPITMYRMETPRAEAFEQLLLKTPVIAKYVRHLNFRVSITKPHLARDPLEQVVPQLTRLQSLSISMYTSPPDLSLNWNDISSSMQNSILNLAHLPTVRDLYLETMSNFPIFHLITCTNLKHLYVGPDLQITDELDEPAASSMLGNLMQPQSLIIGLSCLEISAELIAFCCPDGRPGLDLTCLEKISISVENDEDWTDTLDYNREIFTRAHRLTDIKFEGDEMSNLLFPAWYWPHIYLFCVVTYIDFQTIELAKTIAPSLETVRRVELILTIDGQGEDPLLGLCDELERISGENKLESIKIDIKMEDECKKIGDEWGRLSKILLTSGWPMLKYVSLAVIINWRIRLDTSFGTALKSLPQTQLAGVMARKDLDFQFSLRVQPMGRFGRHRNGDGKFLSTWAMDNLGVGYSKCLSWQANTCFNG